ESVNSQGDARAVDARETDLRAAVRASYLYGAWRVRSVSRAGPFHSRRLSGWPTDRNNGQRTRGDMRRSMGIRAIIAAAGIAGCGDDTGTRMAALPAVPQQVRAQGLVAEGVALVGQEIRLGPGRAVVVPDTTAATVWLERVAQLAF